MSERADPLRVEYLDGDDDLRIARQAPPPGAGSFSATYVGPAGWAFDPAGGEGAARLVNQLVTAAAGSHDRVALARLLDRAGATLARSCDPESAEITIWGPADEWEYLLGVLADVVLRPRFDADDIARVRRQAAERRLREMTQPAARAEREFLRTIFPAGHPYRATGTGDARSLARLRREDLARFHRDHYGASGALVVVTTAASAREVGRAVRRRFSGLLPSRGSPLRVPEPRRTGGGERRVDLTGRSQVEVRVGGPSIARDAPEYPAAFLANELLGGRPLLSRLFQRVREQGGLAYHASSSLEAMRFGGYWVAQAGTGADRWPRVVSMLRDEVRRLGGTDVRRKDLDTIRESAIGEIPLALESTAEAHELAVDVVYHRLPPDFWRTWPARLRAVSPAEVRRAAESALAARSASLVVAGPLATR